MFEPPQDPAKYGNAFRIAIFISDENGPIETNNPILEIRLTPDVNHSETLDFNDAVYSMQRVCSMFNFLIARKILAKDWIGSMIQLAGDNVEIVPHEKDKHHNLEPIINYPPSEN